MEEDTLTGDTSELNRSSGQVTGEALSVICDIHYGAHRSKFSGVFCLLPKFLTTWVSKDKRWNQKKIDLANQRSWVKFSEMALPVTPGRQQWKDAHFHTIAHIWGDYFYFQDLKPRRLLQMVVVNQQSTYPLLEEGPWIICHTADVMDAVQQKIARAAARTPAAELKEQKLRAQNKVNIFACNVCRVAI